MSEDRGSVLGLCFLVGSYVAYLLVLGTSGYFFGQTLFFSPDGPPPPTVKARPKPQQPKKPPPPEKTILSQLMPEEQKSIRDGVAQWLAANTPAPDIDPPASKAEADGQVIKLRSGLAERLASVVLLGSPEVREAVLKKTGVVLDLSLFTDFHASASLLASIAVYRGAKDQRPALKMKDATLARKLMKTPEALALALAAPENLGLLSHDLTACSRARLKTKDLLLWARRLEQFQPKTLETAADRFRVIGVRVVIGG